MKLNIAYPATGAQKLIDIEDELKVRFLYDRRMASEVEMDPLGDEWKGYVCRISGGNDKQGFPMKQGVLTAGRVRLLMSKGTSCYRPRRTGERKRKSVHGCIVDASLSVLNLVVTKKGDAEMPGLTDKTVPRRLGPKRASNIRKLFNLTKTDDVRQYVVRRPLKEKEGKPQRTKAPKIQRLITPRRLQRKRFRVALKKKRAEKSKGEAADYAKLVLQRAREEKERKDEAKRRRSSASKGSDHGKTTPTQSISQQPTVKKSGKVAAQAPEVAQILAGKKGQPSGLETVGMKQGPVAPGASKQKAQSAAGKDAKSRTQAGVGAGGGQKAGAPGRSVKDPQTKKAADLSTATEKKVGGPKPPAGQQPPKKK